MPVSLSELAAPDRTAVLTMEVQRGLIGDLATFPELAAAAAEVGVVPNTARLLTAARSHSVPVVHCTAEFRADRVGSPITTPLVASMVRRPDHLLVGTPPTEVVQEFGPGPDDLISSRLHGVSPFIGTSLDTLLRSLGVRTVVATGVSVNLGVIGLSIEAVNLGYSVVVPRDAVAGVPREYADAMLDNTYALIARLTTVDDLIAAWGDPG